MVARYLVQAIQGLSDLSTNVVVRSCLCLFRAYSQRGMPQQITVQYWLDQASHYCGIPAPMFKWSGLPKNDLGCVIVFRITLCCHIHLRMILTGSSRLQGLLDSLHCNSLFGQCSSVQQGSHRTPQYRYRIKGTGACGCLTL